MRDQEFHPPHQTRGAMSPLPQPFHLPAFFGIPAHRYLIWCFALFCVLLLFFLLAYPGLWRPQGVLSLDTLPQHSRVYVDNKYHGETPLDIQLTAGEHLVRFEKPFFETAQLSLNIKKQVFAQLFYKPKQYVSKKLELKAHNTYNTLRFYWQDYVLRGLEAAALPTFSRGYAFPPLLQSAFRDLAYAQAEQLPAEEQLYPLFASLLTKTTNRYQLSDLLNAAVIASSAKQLPSIIQLSQLFKQLPKKLQLYDKEELQLWLQEVPPSMGLSATWFEKFPIQTHARGARENGQTEAEFLEISGVGFLKVNTAENVFYIQQSEVSYQQYADFIAEQSQWDKRRSSFAWQESFPTLYGEQELVEEPWKTYQQLHTEGYLAPWPGQNPPPLLKDYPLAYIDFSAANAYASWFSKKLSAVLGDCWQAGLPKSEQWQLAYEQLAKFPPLEQRSSFAFPPAIPFDKLGTLEIVGLDSGLSEWLRNRYQAYAFWQADKAIEPLIRWLDPPLVEIQASNWLNYKKNDQQTRGWLLQNNFDLPSDTSSYRAIFPATVVSSFIGFRLVLEEDCSSEER